MAEAAANANGAMPQLNVLAQYTKDFSFENPNAPRSLAPQANPPEISIQVNVNVQQIAETEFDVTLMMEGHAGEKTNLLFGFELAYGGVFRVMNIPADQLHAVIMIECPRLLFPFARQIIADAVRHGGFPPLYIDPIDFVSLYQQKLAEVAQESKDSTLS